MSQQNNQRRHIRGAIAGLFVMALLIASAVALYVNQQYVYDTIRFWTYQPSSDIAAIAKRTTMTDNGTFMFYAAQPEIDGRDTFSQKCGQKEQGTAILGCYTSNKIYVYNVTDSRLDGIKEVTAAHEMLHAVYQRLSDSERQSVNRLVEAEYAKLSADPAFSERMAFYARTEPGQRDNELHSIIGTEIRSISPELSAHYAKYFSDRSSILNLYDSYSQTFKTLDSEREALGKQIDSLKNQIDTQRQAYDRNLSSLNDDINSFNKQSATATDARSISSLNATAASLRSRSVQIESERVSINNQIDQLKSLVEQYNATVTESQGLYQSIDSTLTPVPKV